MITRLAHLCFKTHDLGKMTEFYTGVLGLKIKFSFRNARGQVFGHYFELGSLNFLEIFDIRLSAEHWGGRARSLRAKARSTYQHFCLEVRDIEAVARELSAKGVEVTPPTVGMDNSKQIWIKDPDGNLIEFMEYTEKSLQIV
jgi:catechol 2,3-dioxygenase-like lactoylglutathione lyase family enzyme